MPWKELEKAKSIFEQALELPSGQRLGFLESACEGDTTLRLQVEHLLAEFESNSTDVNLPFDSSLGRSLSIAPELSFPETTRFAVQRHLGAGAFGAVYQVWDR